MNRRSKGGEEDREDDAEQSHNLPDSYCTIMLNHRKVYRTRTKPKNAIPFFNAGTERFVADWRTTEVMISVRDSREARTTRSWVLFIYLSGVCLRSAARSCK